jgi:hypothetical protein
MKPKNLSSRWKQDARFLREERRGIAQTLLLTFDLHGESYEERKAARTLAQGWNGHLWCLSRDGLATPLLLSRVRAKPETFLGQKSGWGRCHGALLVLWSPRTPFLDGFRVADNSL